MQFAKEIKKDNVCDVSLSLYPDNLKNMPDHGGNRTYDLCSASPMLCHCLNFHIAYAEWFLLTSTLFFDAGSCLGRWSRTVGPRPTYSRSSAHANSTSDATGSIR